MFGYKEIKTMTEKLFSCPLCGGKMHGVEMLNDTIGVICEDCLMVVSFFFKDTEEEVINAWNRYYERGK